MPKCRCWHSLVPLLPGGRRLRRPCQWTNTPAAPRGGRRLHRCRWRSSLPAAMIGNLILLVPMGLRGGSTTPRVAAAACWWLLLPVSPACWLRGGCQLRIAALPCRLGGSLSPGAQAGLGARSADQLSQGGRHLHRGVGPLRAAAAPWRVGLQGCGGAEGRGCSLVCGCPAPRSLHTRPQATWEDNWTVMPESESAGGARFKISSCRSLLGEEEIPQFGI